MKPNGKDVCARYIQQYDLVTGTEALCVVTYPPTDEELRNDPLNPRGKKAVLNGFEPKELRYTLKSGQTVKVHRDDEGRLYYYCVKNGKPLEVVRNYASVGFWGMVVYAALTGAMFALWGKEASTVRLCCVFGSWGLFMASAVLTAQSLGLIKKVDKKPQE